MSLCREYVAGEMMRCPNFGREGGRCNAPLQKVGEDSKARVCVGATDPPGPHSVVKCKWCHAQVRIEVWPIHPPRALAAPSPGV